MRIHFLFPAFLGRGWSSGKFAVETYSRVPKQVIVLEILITLVLKTPVSSRVAANYASLITPDDKQTIFSLKPLHTDMNGECTVLQGAAVLPIPRSQKKGSLFQLAVQLQNSLQTQSAVFIVKSLN